MKVMFQMFCNFILVKKTINGRVQLAVDYMISYEVSLQFWFVMPIEYSRDV
jgi:hypothetical protein